MKRIQIKMYQKLPPNTKLVARPSKWGNPFKLIKHGGQYTLEESLKLYTEWLRKKCVNKELNLQELKGYDYLACYCPMDQSCHADILVSWMNYERG